jgi:predicted enzyme related to lactoylglutathione lyase
MQQPINRVSHVVYCLEAEHLDGAVEFFSEVVGAKFEDSSRPELGLRVMVALERGLELIAPAPEFGPVAERFLEHLKNNGEGLYDVVYGVGDLDETAERAEAFGVRVTHRGSFADMPPWKGRFRVLEEAHLEPFHGVKVTFGQIEPI